MSHQEKQSIFDEYAKSQDYADWLSLEFEFEIFLMNVDEFMSHVFAACDLVQEELQKKISENIKMIDLNEGRSNIECFVVDKSSIINPENIIR